METQQKSNRIKQYIIVTAVLVVISIPLHVIPWQSHLQIYFVLETMAALFSMLIAILALTRLYMRQRLPDFFLGCGFLSTGLWEGLHVVGAITPFSEGFATDFANLSPWFWLATRLSTALFLGGSWLAWNQEDVYRVFSFRRQRDIYFLVCVLVIVVTFSFIYVPVTPLIYPESLVSRPFELVPAFFFIMTFIGYGRLGTWVEEAFPHWLRLTLLCNIVIQVVYIPFSSVLFDGFFTVAYFLKIVSYFMLLLGFAADSLRLFRLYREREEQIVLTNQTLTREAGERFAPGAANSKFFDTAY